MTDIVKLISREQLYGKVGGGHGASREYHVSLLSNNHSGTLLMLFLRIV